MEVKWSKSAYEDFQLWKKKDTNKVKRIKKILANISETPYEGIGKPEPLRFDLSGWWSRRIDNEHRLVYRVVEKRIEVLSCMYHYD